MNKVAIFADSTIDLTPEDIKKYDIQLVSLLVKVGETEYRDCVDITPDELYAHVAETGTLPKTAAIPPQTFIESFKPFIEKGYDIIVFSISKDMSATHQNAIIASKEFPEGRIFAFDGQNLSSGTGLLVLKAVKFRQEGKSASEINELLKPLVPLLSVQFAVDTLTYLYKGGRCSGTSALFGKLLHIHPIIKVVNGKMIVYKKPRGKMEKALDELADEIAGDMPNVDLDNVMVTHSGISDDLIKYLADKVAIITGKPNIIKVTRAGCVISSHCGYGTIGVLYIKTK